ncbi:MAG: hypothetical protein ACREXY_17845 [Gammaproteobacteria bacterium]
MNQTTSVFVGIDVSKALLDVAVRPSGTTLRFRAMMKGVSRRWSRR